MKELQNILWSFCACLLLFGCAGMPFSEATSSLKEVIKGPKIGSEYAFSLGRIRGHIEFSDENSHLINSIVRFEMINESDLPMTVLVATSPRYTSMWNAPVTVAPMSRKLLFEGLPRDINAYLGESGGDAMKLPVKGRLVLTFLKGRLPKEVRIFDVVQGDVL